MTEPLPAVSVVIPCYNHGRYVHEAIKSVEKCDSNVFEIIVVNDGSTDPHTIDVMKQLSSDGYHVINQSNQGLATARNNAIKVARGRYILPLDADNKIYPEYVSIGVRVLDEQPKVGVVYGRPELVGDTNSRPYPDVGPFDLRRLVIENYIDACAVIRKSALEESGLYDKEFPYPGWEDWDLWLMLSYAGWQFHFEDALLFQYRIVADSMISETRQPERSRKNIEYLSRKHAMLLRQVLITQHDEILYPPKLVRYAQVLEHGGLKGFVEKAIKKVKRRTSSESR